jgi:hypothetical protein
MKTYRVYQYYVGCFVFDAEAPDGASALEEALRGNAKFLHEANDALENRFFAEVFTYDEDGSVKDDPVFTENPTAAKLWREWPYG